MKIGPIDVLKIVVTTALMCFIYWKVDTWKVIENIRLIDVRFFVMAVAISFCALLLQSVKTHILIPEYPVGLLFKINVIGQFFGIVLLGQLGSDIAKTGYLLRNQGDPHRILAAVLFDRITSLSGLAILAAAGLVFSPIHFGDGVIWSLGIVISILLASLLAPILINSHVADSLLRPFPGEWSGRLQRTYRAIRVFSANPARLLLAVALGILVQVVIVANCWVVAAGLGIDLPLATWAVVIGMMSLVLMLPISVGGIGLRDVTLVGLLGNCGVAADAALAMSLGLLALQLIMAAAGGLLLLMPAPAAR